MSIDEKTVAKIARLSRIRVSEEDKAHYAAEISGILKWVEQLSEVDTSGVAPMASVVNQKLPWREDVITDGNQQQAVIANAPGGAQHGCFTVPKVIE
jgi:aspartyl-tRNA(Asn)/glutamyl-tRNA(Gln) amidotransferase subunit C